MSLADYAIMGDFSSDTAKIIYSHPFRRMSLKSQVIIKPTGDHFRSRLIHTGEVNQVALTIGRELGLNLELISAIAWAHDLGHTPFGHAGERALQTILERELSVRFGIKGPRKKRDAEAFLREIFHHSSNSVRILVKEKEFENGPISDKVIYGVLTHSWSPWKRDTTHPVPTTYEAQAVAIADQIASINHDTEDIIEGAPYTEYDRDNFSGELIAGFKNKFPSSYRNIQNNILNFIVDKSIEVGYGRQRRIETIIKEIVDHARTMFKRNGVTKSEQAKDHTISPSEDWCNYLWFYERFIRDLIQEKVSWFIGRDNMSAALISTVFNHLWPRARTSGAIVQMKAPMFPEEDRVKTGIEEETRYIDHFISFFEQHYKDGDHYKRNFLNRVQTRGIPVWDAAILKRSEKKLEHPQFEVFTRLIAVIDFIAGLTDRRCLAIFNDVYRQFVAT